MAAQTLPELGPKAERRRHLILHEPAEFDGEANLGQHPVGIVARAIAFEPERDTDEHVVPFRRGQGGPRSKKL